MKNLIVLLALSLTFLACSACGRDQEIDPELQLLVDHYLKFAPNEGKLGLVSSIKFGSPRTDEDARGECRRDKDHIYKWNYQEERSIVIARKKYVLPLATVVYHELGHCLHDLPHTDGPHDLMNPDRKGGETYWTPEKLDEALVAMFAGVKMP